MRTLLCLALLPLAGLAGPEGRHYDLRVVLDGRTPSRPAAETVYEMRGPAREVVFHLVFERGLYRKSRHDNTRGTTGGVYLEVNDADEPTHPVHNPFCPMPLQPGANPDWMDFVSHEFPFPNPEPGYWYTSGKLTSAFERPLRLRFAARGRYRIRIRGVLADDRDDVRVPTLVGVTEIGPALDRPAPDYRKKTLLQHEAERTAREDAGEPASDALAVPTGKRETSVLLLRRVAPAAARVGEPYEFHLEVTNLTKQAVLGVVVIETGEARLRYGAGPTDADETTASWDLGEIGPGETRRLTGTATPLEAGALERAVLVRYDSDALVQTTTVVK